MAQSAIAPLEAILATVVTKTWPRSRQRPTIYVIFGDSPPIGPMTYRDIVSLSMVCSYRVDQTKTTYFFPPLEEVRTRIYDECRNTYTIFRGELRALAALGVATVRECLVCEMYVGTLLDKYPTHAKELYAIYFDHNKYVDNHILLPEYLSDDQIHYYSWCDRDVPHVSELIADWGGHSVYCSVTARLAYTKK